MECAALWSLLVTLPREAIPSNRFRERRDRPFCHLMIRQQTWQEFQNSDRRRWTADVGIALAISTPGAFCVRRHLQAIRLPAVTAAADRLLLCTKAPDGDPRNRTNHRDGYGCRHRQRGILPEGAGDDRSKSSQPPLRPRSPTLSQFGIEKPSAICPTSHSWRSRRTFVSALRRRTMPVVIPKTAQNVDDGNAAGCG
jgi:hypothetical protein